MKIHHGYEGLDLVSPVVTMGIFDGVHRGHGVLLESLVSKARQSEGTAVVVTFYPHPKQVLDPSSKNFSFLTTIDEKISRLRKSGVDHLVIIEFTREFSRIAACDFIKDILYGKIGTRHLLIGFNHRFGRDGGGDVDTLNRCAAELNFKVEQVGAFHDEKGPISSSIIREALLKGNTEDANRLLGYNYSLTGSVIEGRKIGHTLGFPTANIKPHDELKLIPGNGVYAVEVVLEGRIHPGMLSIGVNPTVNSENKRTIEVHIIDFMENIYDKELTVIFHKRLRDEIKFRSTDELSRQMVFDKEHVLRILR